MSERSIDAIQQDLNQANAAVDAAKAKARAFAVELAAAQTRQMLEAQLSALPPAARAAALAQMVEARSAT